MSKHNVFSKDNAPVPNPPRNTFDLSRQDLFTTDFGVLKPVYCKEVLPGDSFKIDSACVIQGMPTVFPIQTRVRCNVHYFYVRNRTLWNKWQDFIFKTKDGLTPPYLQMDEARYNEMFKIGGIADMLGVPVTAAEGQAVLNFDMPTYSSGRPVFGGNFVNNVVWSTDRMLDTYAAGVFDSKAPSDLLPLTSSLVFDVGSSLSSSLFIEFSNSQGPTYHSAVWRSLAFSRVIKSLTSHDLNMTSSPANVLSVSIVTPKGVVLSSVVHNLVGNTDGSLSLVFDEDEISAMTNALINFDYFNLLLLRSSTNGGSTSLASTGWTYQNSIWYNPKLSSSENDWFDNIVQFTSDDVVAVSYGESKFSGDNPTIPISALPFRAYTMVMNYFYRNDLNNPYILNGEVQYNEFIPSHEGGADTNLYLLQNRIWELDRYTSAVPSPQFGEAPLVGIIAKPGRDTAVLTFKDSSNPVSPETAPVDGTQYNVTVKLDDLGGIAGIIDYDSNTPSGSLRNIMDLSTAGISINDLRNINSFQKFLENSLRRGLRYRNQLKSHFGVSVDYPDIDVPQFIGGYSELMTIGRTTQSAETAEGALGDFAGSIFGTPSSNHSIHCYCPEHGFILGIMSICPVPTYSQNLDPMFTRYTAFDYFQQEFSKIGNVPIFMREVAPNQTDDPDAVFGYQRAFYDYISDMDKIHGDFRTTLKDFVLTRVFAEAPTLSESFTRVSDDQLNDIWMSGYKVKDKYGSSSKFLCQIYHDVRAKRQIPRYGVPSLE